MSTRRKLAFLAGAIAISTIGAWYRWPDSVHAIGVVKQGGGTARHPVALAPGQDEYVIIATATVLPPWAGDAVVALEGEPAPEWDLEVSRPVVDLGLHHFPRLDGRTLRGLRPRDRVALWVRLRPPPACPVCGMACAAEKGAAARGAPCFCSEACAQTHRADPAAHPPRPLSAASWRLALRDEATGAPVLTIPIGLGGEGASHEGHH